jgi:hypothetical protein
LYINKWTTSKSNNADWYMDKDTGQPSLFKKNKKANPNKLQNLLELKESLK